MLRAALAVLVVATLLPPIASGQGGVPAPKWGVPLSHRELQAQVRWSKAVGAPTRCVSEGEDYAIAHSIRRGWLGRMDAVRVGGRVHRQVILSTRTCYMLLNAERENLPWHVLIDAIFTLAHESVHVDGVMNEKMADCIGARRWERVAKVAGYTVPKRAVKAYFKGNTCRSRR